MVGIPSENSLHTSSMSTEEQTHFGFRDVGVGEKSRMVRSVFDSVAPRYDLMNDLMSGGIHRLWKAALIDWLRPTSSMHLLDVAGGTGDIAFRYRASGGGPVTICDINEQMLSHGRDRSIDRNQLTGLDWCVGDGEALPVADRSVDAYTIAFGLRNITHPEIALAEARRVLKPGGRFLCLEFSHVTLPWLAGLYERYSFQVLPLLGRWVAKDAESYRYLAESIRRFPPQSELAAMIRDAGFDQVAWRDLTGGVVALHSGWRI